MPSPEPGEVPEGRATNGDGPSSSRNEKDQGDSEADDDKPSGSSMEERWPAVKAAQANEPVGIITIEDVLEELIGTVRASNAF